MTTRGFIASILIFFCATSDTNWATNTGQAENATSSDFSLNGANPKIAIYCYQIASVDKRCRIHHPCDTGNPIFSGDNCAMYQHSAPSFDNSSSQRGQKCHSWVNRVDCQNFTSFKILQLPSRSNNPDPLSAATYQENKSLSLPSLYSITS